MIEELDVSVEEKKKNNVPLLIILIILILLAFVLIYLLFIRKEKVDDPKNDDTITFGKTIINKSNATLKDNIVTIKKGGNYILKGTSEDACVVVDTNESVVVTLSDVNLKCKNDAVISILNALNTTIVLEENSLNKLSDVNESEHDAVIYSKSPLIISGLGILEVNGNNNEGIATTDADISINNGTIIIDSKDDGINAGGIGGLITINDGVLYINAKGDGIDSNKGITFNGGKTFIMSTTNDNCSIDSDIDYTINGGTIVALGNGKIQLPGNSSTQRSIVFNLDDIILSNYILSLKGTDEIITFTSKEDFRNVIISSPLIKDSEYNLYYKGESSGKLSYGIYYDGIFTKGNKLKVNDSDLFKVNKIVNYFGKEIKR